MHIALRIIVGLPGVFFVLSGLQFLFAPEAAVEGLGMELLDGVGRSTQLGDFATFFTGLGVMILLGAIRLDRRWLLTAAAGLAGAAFFRSVSAFTAGAAFATQFIVIEAVLAGLLFYAARQVQGAPGAVAPSG